MAWCGVGKCKTKYERVESASLEKDWRVLHTHSALQRSIRRLCFTRGQNGCRKFSLCHRRNVESCLRGLCDEGVVSRKHSRSSLGFWMRQICVVRLSHSDRLRSTGLSHCLDYRSRWLRRD